METCPCLNSISNLKALIHISLGKAEMWRCDFNFLSWLKNHLILQTLADSSYSPMFSLVKHPGVPLLQLKLVGVRKHRWMGACSALASVMDIKNDVQLQVSILQYAKNHQPGFPRLTYGIPSSNYLAEPTIHPSTLGPWLPPWDLQP